MKKNKLILKIAAVVAAASLIAAGTLSYFTDKKETSVSAMAGSLDIDVQSDIKGKDILIPGKDYYFTTQIDNVGNKSADVMMVITLESDDGYVFMGDLPIVKLFLGSSYERTVVNDKTVRYTVENTLNGNPSFGDNREIESGVTSSGCFSFASLYIGDYSCTEATYVKMTVDFYAKQHRNVSDWELIETYEEVAGN